MKEREKITLVCTSLNPNKELLNKMLLSAKAFDEVVLHLDGFKISHWVNGDKNSLTEYGITDHFDIPTAYNFLISYVETQWICCMCDDDYFYPEGLSKMIDEVHEGIVAGVAHFKFHISGYAPPEDKRCWFGKKEYDLCEPKKVTPQLLQKHNRLPAASFFRKRAWEMAGGFQGDKFHDWDLWKRMVQSGIKFKYFDHLVYNFVRRENSAWIRQSQK